MFTSIRLTSDPIKRLVITTEELIEKIRLTPALQAVFRKPIPGKELYHKQKRRIISDSDFEHSLYNPVDGKYYPVHEFPERITQPVKQGAVVIVSEEEACEGVVTSVPPEDYYWQELVLALTRNMIDRCLKYRRLHSPENLDVMGKFYSKDETDRHYQTSEQELAIHAALTKLDQAVENVRRLRVALEGEIVKQAKHESGLAAFLGLENLDLNVLESINKQIDEGELIETELDPTTQEQLAILRQRQLDHQKKHGELNGHYESLRVQYTKAHQARFAELDLQLRCYNNDREQCIKQLSTIAEQERLMQKDRARDIYEELFLDMESNLRDVFRAHSWNLVDIKPILNNRALFVAIHPEDYRIVRFHELLERGEIQL